MSVQRLPEKEKESEGKYHWHVLARQDQLCLPVGKRNCPTIWWSLAAAKLELTYRDTLQHSSIREGERAHKLTVLYCANKNPADAFPLRKEVLAKALTQLTILLSNRCSNAKLLGKLLASY